MAGVSHDSETPAQGQQVFTACAFIHKQLNGVDVVFLAKRAATKKFLPGMYELPGGHVDYGEDIIKGLQRDMAEELSVRVTIGDPFYVYTYQNLIKGSHTIEVIYFATFAQSEEDIQIVDDDHSDYGWFTEEQVMSIVADNRAGVTQQASIQTDTDDEMRAMLKGFNLLKGTAPDYAIA